MSDFPLRQSEAITWSLSALAERLQVAPPARDLEVRGVAPLATASGGQLGFLASANYLNDLRGSQAGALLVGSDLVERVAQDPRPRIVVADPHRALALLVDLFHPELQPEPAIHPTAVLGRGVKLGSGVTVGPYAVLEEGVVVGDGTRVGAHVVVGAESRIGSGVLIHPQVVIYPRSLLGDRVILHAGVRVGVDGFGYVSDASGHQKVPQVGACVIEDDVEIGANTTIDRGSIGATRIGTGVKIDNLVQLAHNVSIGPFSLLVAQVGVAGSTEFGSGVVAGGQSGFTGHIRVGDGARIAAQTGIMGDVEPGAIMMGFPGRPRMEYLRTTAAQARVVELVREIRDLRRRLAALEGAGEKGPLEEGGTS